MAKTKYVPPKKYPAAINGPGGNGLEGGTKFFDRMGRKIVAAGGVAPKGVIARFNVFNEALKGGAPVGTKFAPGALRGLRDNRNATGGKGGGGGGGAGGRGGGNGGGHGGGGSGGGGGAGPPPSAAAALADIYAEGDTAITDLGGMRGKQYKGTGGTARGQTTTPRNPKAAPSVPTGKQAKNLKNRGKKQKSGTKAGMHINKAGDVVPNKGRKNK